MMEAPIAATGTTLEPGTPIVLFETRVVGGGAISSSLGRNFDVSPDGRFLINTVSNEVTPITLLLNWTPPGTK